MKGWEIFMEDDDDGPLLVCLVGEMPRGAPKAHEARGLDMCSETQPVVQWVDKRKKSMKFSTKQGI